MKIGIFSIKYGMGGTERVTNNLVKYLKTKHDVEVLLWKHIRIPPFDNIWLLPLSYLNKQEYDVYFNLVFGGSLFASKLFEKPIVHYFHKPPLENPRLIEKIGFTPILALEKMHKYLKYIPTACNSKYTQKKIKEFYNISPKVIYPPVNTKKFKPSKRRKKFILMTGRITPFKKYEKILNFMNHKEVIIAGFLPEDSINYYMFLRRRFPKVKFRLNVSEKDLIKLYQECKIYIFPNPEEHFGIVPFEAMACGKTVLIPEGCGASELIRDGKNGYLFKNDYSNFQEKLNEALNSDVGKKARKSIEKTLSIEDFGKKMFELIS